MSGLISTGSLLFGLISIISLSPLFPFPFCGFSSLSLALRKDEEFPSITIFRFTMEKLDGLSLSVPLPHVVRLELELELLDELEDSSSVITGDSLGLLGKSLPLLPFPPMEA
uniref:Uncharacterized protein n=1 Tax=Cacopsylla melanoneura TaxID=428564 RepID=A0A8D9AD45_9HEMI